MDFAGNTGPFIQYTYARIQSILRKAPKVEAIDLVASIDEREKEIIKHLLDYPAVVQQAAGQHSPALIANYSYDLVKLFNSFYQNISILGEDNLAQRDFRITLAKEVSLILKQSMSLLGIELPSRM